MTKSGMLLHEVGPRARHIDVDRNLLDKYICTNIVRVRIHMDNSAAQKAMGENIFISTAFAERSREGKIPQEGKVGLL